MNTNYTVYFDQHMHIVFLREKKREKCLDRVNV